MPIDTPARRLDYRGRIVGDDWMAKGTREYLRGLAEQFPDGARIVHTGGRQGTVALDQPPHVPGLFDGGPTAVCLVGPTFSEPMVFAYWDNTDGFDRWGVWAPVASVRRVPSRSLYRPVTPVSVRRPRRKAGQR